jgi:hypothetical protein
MAERDADYRGFHIIINTTPTSDGKWQAHFTLHDADIVTPFNLDLIERPTEESVVEAAIDRAQREIDKILLYRGFASDQDAELKRRGVS